MEPPLISVCLITYNHVKYIRQAIEGVLMQKLTLSWELIIADDCSSDGTLEIISEFKKKYPDFITLILQEKNIGPAKNWLDLITRPKSNYIAYFEGDDYWTDPYKLQKQVDFLEANSDFVICYHPVDVLFPDGKFEEDYGIKGLIDKTESNIYDLAVLGNYIHTPSVVFRNVLTEYPESMKKSPIGDFFLWMLLAQYGKIKKLPDAMAVYRNSVGVYLKNDYPKRLNDFIYTLELIKDTVNNKTVSQLVQFRIDSLKFESIKKNVGNYKMEFISYRLSIYDLIKGISSKIIKKII